MLSLENDVKLGIADDSFGEYAAWAARLSAPPTRSLSAGEGRGQAAAVQQVRQTMRWVNREMISQIAAQTWLRDIGYDQDGVSPITAPISRCCFIHGQSPRHRHGASMPRGKKGGGAGGRRATRA